MENYLKERIQVNLIIPIEWRDKLREIAKSRSAELGFNITLQDLIRSIIKKEFNF